jgi:hypothetical protein
MPKIKKSGIGEFIPGRDYRRPHGWLFYWPVPNQLPGCRKVIKEITRVLIFRKQNFVPTLQPKISEKRRIRGITN